jgi:thiosulfate/3-mercaptopyruvate sulfurtransferase
VGNNRISTYLFVGESALHLKNYLMWKSLIKASEIPLKSVIVDCSWHFKPGFNGRQDFVKKRIPNAIFFNLDECVDKMSSYPHMLPSESDFSKYCSDLGIHNDDSLVLYDTFGLFSSPRIWWMFKCFGHTKVSVLDGGIHAWQGDFDSGESSPLAKTNYVASTKNKDMIIQYNEVISSLNFNGDVSSQFLDARPSGRFTGASPEPRPIPSGHVPGSFNVPFGDLLDDKGTMKSKDELMAVFEAKRIDLSRPIVCSCGSGNLSFIIGVTAAIIYLALEVIGKSPGVKLYDGSWSEYASRTSSPIQRL